MAGIYAYFGPPDSARLNAAARRLTFFGECAELIEQPDFSAAWVGHDDPPLFGPAFDPSSGVRVLSSGRISFDEPDWRRAATLTAFEGGLSNRFLLDRYLRHGPEALDRHNGPAALMVWDPRRKRVYLWTDHFGYHPVFLYAPDSTSNAIISTFPDAIAADPSAAVSPDMVAMAEFLSAWRVTPPHTYYREIKHAGAATRSSWDLRHGTFERTTYWRPFEEERFPGMEEASEELAAAVSHAVRIRTLPRLGPIVSFTSGGLDSRAILFSAASPQDMIAVNLYDVPNKESAISERLCARAGVRYVGFARDDDYYPRWMRDGSRISGSMWSLEDNHFLGTRGLVSDLGARTVMTACTTDWLFKGYGLEKQYIRFGGRNLPIQRLVGRRVDGFLPNIPRGVPEEFRAQVRERLEECFEGTARELGKDADWLAVEDRRIRPACYTVSVSGQIMYRIFPYDTFLADRRVADCYARSKASWKINALLWGKAVRRICAAGKDIEDANFGWRVGSSTVTKLAMFAKGWIKRRVTPAALPPDGLATDGSWPNLAWYVQHSATLRDEWESVAPEHREVIRAVWGADPWIEPFTRWARAPNDLFRIMTLSLHLARAVRR